MSEMRVVGVRVELPANQPILLLRETEGERYLPIWIGPNEATAIAFAQQGMVPQRPLTHDLLAHILRALGARVERAIINDLKRGTYFARLILNAENELQQKKIVEIDARPSDCIAMATQQTAPIYVSREVWEEVEDMSDVLRKMEEESSQSEETDEEE